MWSKLLPHPSLLPASLPSTGLPKEKSGLLKTKATAGRAGHFQQWGPSNPMLPLKTKLLRFRPTLSNRSSIAILLTMDATAVGHLMLWFMSHAMELQLRLPIPTQLCGDLVNKLCIPESTR